MDLAPVAAKKSAILNEDVLWLTFKHLTPIDIASVRLTCKSLSTPARPFLYRSFVVRARHLDSSSEPEELEYKKLLRRYMRNLEVDSVLDWNKFANLIYRLQKLDTFNWNLPSEPIALPVLDNLRRRWPNIPLDLRHYLQSHIAPQSQLSRLTGCSNLRSIKMTVHLTWGLATYPGLNELKEVLISCKGLRRLDLSFTFRGFQAADGSSRFCFGEGEQLPPFEELVLDGYYWRKNEPCAAAWDWSRLRRLTLRRMRLWDFLQSVKGKISHLDYLELKDINGICNRKVARALNDFVGSQKGLKELVLPPAAQPIIWFFKGERVSSVVPRA